MTTLVQQKGGSDCVLAAIAMAAGKTWEELWTQEDLNKTVETKGIADMEPWLERAGFKDLEHYREVYVHEGSVGVAKAMLWKRRALLSVKSLNISGGSHMVYWDGEKLFDPHEGHYPQYLAFRHLSSCMITRAYIFC